jgi:hypothetical protein
MNIKEQLKNMSSEDRRSLRREIAAKEAHDDENIQKLAEGCIWIGATWMANALGIKL